MNSESQPYSSLDAEILAEIDAEQQKRGASSYGPLIGLGLMAAITFPLLCVAAVRARTPGTQVAGVTGGTGGESPLAVTPTTPKYIYWNYNFQAAQQQASTANKSMMIDFYTDWCPSCKSLDAQVFTEPAIAAEAANIIPIKINAEAQTDLAQRYNITKYPTIIWTDSQGNEKYRQSGWTSVYDFYQTMQQNR